MDINKDYHLAFSVSTVYAAWVSPNTVIPPATAMDILPKVGGHYRLTASTPELTMTNEGVFSIVEPDSHIRYTWEWNKDGEVTEIDVRFNATGSGTQIILVHSGFKNQQSLSMHNVGWDSYIQGLESFLVQASS